MNLTGLELISCPSIEQPPIFQYTTMIIIVIVIIIIIIFFFFSLHLPGITLSSILVLLLNLKGKETRELFAKGWK